MEHFYDDEFERYLKHQADQFKMIPSKKAWYGIYNNFHPGRRWPSAATGLMIVLLLTITGSLNTHQQKVVDNAFQHTAPASHKSVVITKDKISADDALFDKGFINDLLSIQQSLTNTDDNPTPLNNSTTENNLLTPNTTLNNTIAKSSSSSIKEQGKLSNTINTDKSSTTEKKISLIANRINTSTFSDPSMITKSDKSILGINSSPSILTGVDINQPHADLSVFTLSASSGKTLSTLNNIFKKRGRPLQWSFYVSPTINYRIVGNTPSTLGTNNGTSSNYMANNVINKTSQHPALGIEIGTNAAIQITQNLQLLSGFQVNYSGYNITASHAHPVIASIQLMNNGAAQDVSTISFYSNNTNQSSVTLHTYNLEASIPLGVKYKIFDNDQIQFSLMSAMQPSFVIAEKSYLLSTDTRNYVSYPELHRGFNINSEFGLYAGFKAGRLKYEVGPEFRYQLLSNYKRSSAYSEHLINYGIRFAIIR